jgi:acyl-coenzyme A thioesterase PaaI-like protein
VNDATLIRERVLRGLALNRTPGYHYTGNFLEFSFERVTEPLVHMTMPAGPHITEANGNCNYAMVAVFADMAMAANIRAGHQPYSRLATVQMNLQFTGAPMTGALQLESRLQDYIAGITSKQGATTVTVTANGKPVCLGTGAFMVLDPPPGVALYNMELRKAGDPPVAPLDENLLTSEERKVLMVADAAIARMQSGEAFIQGFLGVRTHQLENAAKGELKNGPHIGNRVGHVQGGITMGLGIATAEAALPANWMLSSVTAWYISPGEGRTLKARSKVVHRGRLTAVVRTEIFGKNNRRVMEMTTAHASKSSS